MGLTILRTRESSLMVKDCKQKLYVLALKLSDEQLSEKDRQLVSNFKATLMNKDFPEICHENSVQLMKLEPYSERESQRSKIIYFQEFHKISFTVPIKDNLRIGRPNHLFDKYDIFFKVAEKYAAYIPLISRLGIHDLTPKRVSNGVIEAYNSLVKHQLHKKILPVNIDRHITKHFNAIRADTLACTDAQYRSLVFRNRKGDQSTGMYHLFMGIHALKRLNFFDWRMLFSDKHWFYSDQTILLGLKIVSVE
jgi:hypothetical protein